MNTAKIATALNTISVAFGELAEALTESPDPVRSGGSEAGTVARPAPALEESPFLPDEFPQPSLADESVEFAQGSEAMCPKHRKPYLPSKFKEGSFYCPADSDDPAWSNSKGKCRITPDNAAQYLRIKAAA